MRLRSPWAVTAESSQVSSVCSRTSDWRKRMQRSGSRPAASRIAVGVVEALAQLGRVVGDRDRVQVDDAEDRRVAAVLALDVLADRPDVVAEVLAPGRLDAGEDDRSRHGRQPMSRLRRRGRSTPPGSPVAQCAGRLECPPRRRGARGSAPPRLGAAGSRSRSRRRSPPAIISTPAIPMPRWKAEVEASSAAAWIPPALPPAIVSRPVEGTASGLSLACETPRRPRRSAAPEPSLLVERRRRSGPR